MTFTAYEGGRITHMKRVENTSTLITIGELSTPDSILKIWQLDKIDKKTKGPHLQATINITPGSEPFPVLSNLVLTLIL